MNIHPIFVHFPIAFLTIYAIAELIRFDKVMSLSWWMNTKIVLLFVGIVGAFFALGTGEFGEDLYASARDIIHVHETVAQITTAVFGALVAYYLVSEINLKWGGQITASSFAKVWSGLMKLVSFIFNKPVIIALAFVGLVAITITGALGGAIVYGPDADPVVHFVYTLFF